MPKHINHFIIYERAKLDDSFIGALISTELDAAQWLQWQTKLPNDQSVKADPIQRPKHEKGAFLAELRRRKAFGSLYLAMPDRHSDVVDGDGNVIARLPDKDQLIEWAATQRVYLVHGAGGKP